MPITPSPILFPAIRAVRSPGPLFRSSRLLFLCPPPLLHLSSIPTSRLHVQEMLTTTVSSSTAFLPLSLLLLLLLILILILLQNPIPALHPLMPARRPYHSPGPSRARRRRSLPISTASSSSLPPRPPSGPAVGPSPCRSLSGAAPGGVRRRMVTHMHSTSPSTASCCPHRSLLPVSFGMVSTTSLAPTSSVRSSFASRSVSSSLPLHLPHRGPGIWPSCPEYEKVRGGRLQRPPQPQAWL